MPNLTNSGVLWHFDTTINDEGVEFASICGQIRARLANVGTSINAYNIQNTNCSDRSIK
jgi:hypothetical protein